MSDTPPIIDTVMGIARRQDDSIWIEDKNVESILDTYLGLKVRMMLCHKPDVGAIPPYLWKVDGDGTLEKRDGVYHFKNQPFTLEPMVGYNCMVTVVNMEFKVATAEELGMAIPSDIEQVLDREKNLKKAINNLADSLDSLLSGFGGGK